MHVFILFSLRCVLLFLVLYYNNYVSFYAYMRHALTAEMCFCFEPLCAQGSFNVFTVDRLRVL